MMRARLGCPDQCEGWVCVDLRGIPSREVMSWLETTDTGSVERIETKNLLEHLADPGRFFKLIHRVLRPGGTLQLITDNAAWLPFYLPFWIKGVGVGAHSINQYAIDHCDSMHFSIFTEMHLKNLAKYAGFPTSRTRMDYGTLGARLILEAVK